MNYYTSDWHLQHANALKFDYRPFNTTQQMEECLIRNWNARVQPQDTVYILGDFSFSKNVAEWNNILAKLKGNKVFIQGNHDYVLHKVDKSLVQGVYNLLQISDFGRKVIMCHYPMAIWNCSHHGSIHLYGHVHNHEEALLRHPILQNLENAYNVGCMNFNYTPVTLDEIIAFYTK